MDQKKRALLRKTTVVKNQEVDHRWFMIDAAGKTLGRLASEITKVLRGKHKPSFTPHADCGDGIIVINVEKVAVTGNKEAQIVYRRHSGFIGGMKETPIARMRERRPENIIEHAVKGMMPKNTLSRHQLKRLRLFAGSEHNMQAQQPVQVNI